ncbi:MAG: DUF1573 domain-containing protein [Bacteroidales bacterium]|nr:DUF1573 domain-containing protein [Bacteroidales bacterium]
MNNILSIIVSLLFAFNYSSEKQSDFKWDKKSVDYGYIQIKNNRQKITAKFTFENIGKENIVIYDVRTFCDCTQVTWSKQPIKPKETGWVIVEYNPKGKSGYFEKKILVKTNTNNKSHVLKIKGLIKI